MLTYFHTTWSKVEKNTFFSQFLINILHRKVHYEPKKCLHMLLGASHHSHNKKWSAGRHFTAQKTVHTTRKAGEWEKCAWEQFYATIFPFLSPVQLWNFDHFFLQNVVIMMITDYENFFHHCFHRFVTLTLYHLRVVGWQKKFLKTQ